METRSPLSSGVRRQYASTVMAQPPSDRGAHRTWLVELTGKLDVGVIIDLGCGRGEDLRLLAARHGATDVRFVGVDASADAVAAASAAMRRDSRVVVRCSPHDGLLPFDDASVDLAYSHNLLECLPNPEGFAREVVRVLRPGGRLVVGHWDWDSQL